MNKLVFVQWTNNFGGLERITADYENSFTKYDVSVIPLRYKENGIKYKNQVKLEQRSKILLLLQYFNYVRKNRSAIFHLQYTRTLILLVTYLAGARKIIYHFHGTKFSNNSWDKIVWKRLQNKITVIANSNYTRDIIISKLGISVDIEIIPNYIDTNYFIFHEKKAPIAKFIITYAGRFDKGKNLNIILETAKCLVERDQNVEIKLFGDGDEKQKIERQIKEYNLAEKVFLPGFTNDMNSVYQSSNLFLFLSSYESFGNVVAEAVLSGTPILCYKIPALSEFISDDLFFINNLIPEEIADKILFIKNNYELITGRLKILNRKLVKFLDNCTISEKLQSIYFNLNLGVIK